MKVQLYDTTLRDGMQGEGMSLSAQEKVRVAHRLDELAGYRDAIFRNGGGFSWPRIAT